jgi:hypothetical protein
MNPTVTIRGRFAGGVFVPDGPLPDTEGVAELVITPSAPQTEPVPRKTLLDIIGKYSRPMSREEIDAEFREERAGWDER